MAVKLAELVPQGNCSVSRLAIVVPLWATDMAGQPGCAYAVKQTINSIAVKKAWFIERKKSGLLLCRSFIFLYDAKNRSQVVHYFVIII
jgi:hypothetical protein